MQTVDTRTVDLMDGWFDGDETVHFHADFALRGASEADDSAAVVIELAPGDALGQYTDSPEEIFLVMEGEVEFQINSERQHAKPGTVSVVPAMTPHTVCNVGDRTARIIGFFPRPRVVSTFVEPIQPLGQDLLAFGDTSTETAAD